MHDVNNSPVLFLVHFGHGESKRKLKFSASELQILDEYTNNGISELLKMLYGGKGNKPICLRKRSVIEKKEK